MITIFIALLGLFLNQALVISNINYSSADFILVIIVFILFYKRQLYLPIKTMMWFLVVSISTLFAGGLLVPFLFPIYQPTIEGIAIGYIKLIAVFFYLVIGFNLERLNHLKQMLKWFSTGALLVGFLSIVTVLIKAPYLSRILFYGSLRLKGLMNDPNYFSVLQSVAIAFFINTKEISNRGKCAAIMILALSVFMSGSKTGMVTLLMYMVIKIMDFAIKKKVRFKGVFKWSGVITLSSFVVVLLNINFIKLISFISSKIPAFARVSIIFFDLNTALSSGGSTRGNTWRMAVELIKASPILGIGLGTYTGIIRNVFNYSSIAHNSYLQLAVEWGLPFAIMFFVLVFYIIFKITIWERNNVYLILLRDILIIFLIASIALSLNNARLFWIVLGGILFPIAERNYRNEKQLSVKIKPLK